MDITLIPHINAGVNVATMVFLVIAKIKAATGDEAAHRRAMMGALAMAVVFMVLYVTYHMNSGLARFGGEGIVRPIYFTILIIHVIGAALIVPLVPWAAWRGIKAFNGDDASRRKHKKLVRWAWPMWFFVALSGFVVYVMALHIWPSQG